MCLWVRLQLLHRLFFECLPPTKLKCRLVKWCAKQSLSPVSHGWVAACALYPQCPWCGCRACRWAHLGGPSCSGCEDHCHTWVVKHWGFLLGATVMSPRGSRGWTRMTTSETHYSPPRCAAGSPCIHAGGTDLQTFHHCHCPWHLGGPAWESR